MKVKELMDKTKVEEITLKITKKEEARAVKGGMLHVCNCTGEDDTGDILVTLWNDDIAKVNEGDTITIKNGWAAIYQDNMQISSGKFGSIEVAGGSSDASEEAPAEEESEEAPAEEESEEAPAEEESEEAPAEEESEEAPAEEESEEKSK